SASSSISPLRNGVTSAGYVPFNVSIEAEDCPDDLRVQRGASNGAAGSGERPAQELALDAHRPLGRDPAGEAEPPIEAGPDRVELPVRLGILGRAGLGEEPRHVHLRAQPPEDRRPAVARDQRAQEPDRPRRELPREIRELALLDRKSG